MLLKIHCQVVNKCLNCFALAFLEINSIEIHVELIVYRTNLSCSAETALKFGKAGRRVVNR